MADDYQFVKPFERHYTRFIKKYCLYAFGEAENMNKNNKGSLIKLQATRKLTDLDAFLTPSPG
jgi:hypothetical protein